MDLPDEGKNADQVPSLRVEDRLSLEIVIALVGPVASGVTTAAELLSETLKEVYDYNVENIKISPLIKEHANEVGEHISDGLTGEERIEKFQLVGNKLRQEKSGSFLIDCAIDKIFKFRVESGGFYQPSNGAPVPLQKRFAYIIDSIKNPAELERLRQVYGDLLWVVTVFAPSQVRLKRLSAGGADELIAQTVMKRDQEDDEATGQQVSKTAHRADYFIRNHADTRDALKKSTDRFLEVIFGEGLHTPTFDEKGMMRASSAALEFGMSIQAGGCINL